MIDHLYTVGGTLLIGLLFADLLMTVFHPQGHGGPLHRRLNRLLWSTLRCSMKGLQGATKDRFFALCGPLIAVFSVGTWGLWLILSFTLLYYPHRSFLWSETGESTWLDVFYFSGYVASTLGIGDIVPVTAALRLLTVVEAMSGFALFAIATTYLLAVYQHVAKEQVIALELAGRLIFEDSQQTQASIGSWGHSTARGLLEVAQAHGQYPVLHYFRPAEPERALVVQVGRLLEVLDSVRPTGSSYLLWAVHRYLSELHSGCLPLPDRQADQSREVSSGSKKGLRNLQADLLRYLEYPVP